MLQIRPSCRKSALIDPPDETVFPGREVVLKHSAASFSRSNKGKLKQGER